MSVAFAGPSHIYILVIVIHDRDEQPTATITRASPNPFRLTKPAEEFDPFSGSLGYIWRSNCRVELFNQDDRTQKPEEMYFAIEARTTSSVRPRVFVSRWYHNLHNLKATYELELEKHKRKTGDRYPNQGEDMADESFRAARFDRLLGDERDFLWLKENEGRSDRRSLSPVL
ncbi:hypothetical protein BDV96DRAFT_673576 [Lophiotrema nucula]|uniref:Uncharacterized protein n=1 Tax=Lophiotrema nucula TaxID=690887 RepID=A0A6A5YLD9_9PLEO|nr:hypothetical protein BDV96DRAFT_673576 [Lophiotrema nucula]